MSERMPVGARVRVNPQQYLYMTVRLRERKGTVVGYNAQETRALVLWDGLKRPQPWHPDTLEAAP